MLRMVYRVTLWDRVTSANVAEKGLYQVDGRMVKETEFEVVWACVEKEDHKEVGTALTMEMKGYEKEPERGDDQRGDGKI